MSEEISDTVAELFTKCFNSGDVLLDWKFANVTAILKKIKSQVNLCKMHESIMRDNIYLKHQR